MMAFLSFLQNDLVCSLISGALCALLLALFGYAVIRLTHGEKVNRLEFLKNYKKGRFVIVYLVAIPLYFLGFIQTSEQTIGVGSFLLSCFLNAVSSTLDLVKLDFGVNGLISYMIRNPVYYAVMIILFALTAVNFLLFSASFLWLKFKNDFLARKAKRAKTIYAVVGDDENSIVLLKSIRDRGLSGILFAAPDSELKDRLFLEKLPYEKCDFRSEDHCILGERVERLFGSALNRGGPLKKNVNVLLATGCEERNLVLTRELFIVLNKERIKTDPQKEEEKAKKEAEKGEGKAKKKDKKGKWFNANCKSLQEIWITEKEGLLKVYVFGELANRSAYEQYIENSSAHIQYLNRYEMTAIDFVDRFPITRFMDERQIDFDRGLIADDCEINVLFIGFGPTNRQIYQKLIADSQFFACGREGIYHKKINCYIFDRAKAYRDKELNFGYFRYSQEFLTEDYPGHEDNYLPLPDYPANDGTVSSDGTPVPWEKNTHFCEFDVHDRHSLRNLRKLFGKEGNVYTYVIVAFGEDLENVDFARNLSMILYADFRQNAYLFAKVKSKSAYEALFDESLKKGTKGKFTIPIHPFGCTERVVYNIANITENPIDRLAKMKSFEFPRGYAGGEASEEIRNIALKNWVNSDLETRTSNFFCCLNLRLKLHLLGFDYIQRDPSKEDAAKEFLAKYFGSEDLKEQENIPFHFDPAVFTDGSLRTALARQEHQRWNACYITRGIVPLPKSEIAKRISKEMDRKLHGNLTTVEGLEEFRRYVKEVRHYDYRILDLANSLLQGAGFQIIRKEEKNIK